MSTYSAVLAAVIEVSRTGEVPPPVCVLLPKASTLKKRIKKCNENCKLRVLIVMILTYMRYLKS